MSKPSKSCKLFGLLNSLVLLRCKVEFTDDWLRANRFTVVFTMLDSSTPFGYYQRVGEQERRLIPSSGTHTHTGFPGCDEKKGLEQLCQALESAIKEIQTYKDRSPS